MLQHLQYIILGGAIAQNNSFNTKRFPGSAIKTERKIEKKINNRITLKLTMHGVTTSMTITDRYRRLMECVEHEQIKSACQKN